MIATIEMQVFEFETFSINRIFDKITLMIITDYVTDWWFGGVAKDVKTSERNIIAESKKSLG